MRATTRRAAVAALLMIPLSTLVGCSEREVVVGPDAGGSKVRIKNRDEDEARARRRQKAGR